MNNIKETWLPVKKWETLYEVSNFGQVRSVTKTRKHWRGGLQISKGKVLKQFKRKGYFNVNLCHDNNRLCANVHRLVCQSFIPNNHNLSVINHKDCNPLNNNLENLEWCTISHNTKHAWDNG